MVLGSPHLMLKSDASFFCRNFNTKEKLITIINYKLRTKDNLGYSYYSTLRDKGYYPNLLY